MTIYIAGPMSGHKDYNLPQFEAMRNIVQGRGHIGLIPHDYSREFLSIRCPAMIWCLSMVRCVDVMLSADAVLFLDGWEHSAGARREHEIARAHGKTIYYYSL